MYEDHAEALREIAAALRKLGLADAGTAMGAVESHSIIVEEASVRIASALHDVAEAIREHKAGG